VSARTSSAGQRIAEAMTAAASRLLDMRECLEALDHRQMSIAP
jgi:hypothetical protein